MTAQTSPSDTFAPLKSHKFMNLTTFRKSGVAVKTPVWFAYTNGKLVGTTQPQAGKLKRIRNNAKVTVAPSTVRGDPLGDPIDGVARVLAPEEFKAADEAMKRKYGLQYTLFIFMMRLRGGKQTFWEVAPN